MKKKDYEKPTMRVVMLQQPTQLLADSNAGASGGGKLGGGWTDSGGDAWGGSGSSDGGGSLGGGWTDSGDNAWE